MTLDYVTFYFIISILAIHFIADFICQTDEQAKGKSKDNWVLFDHVLNYTTITTVLYCLLIYPIVFINKFHFVIVYGIALLIFITHYGQDWITSRINSKLWADGKVHLFFVGIGLDQLIHFATLFGIFYLINQII